MRTSKFTYAHQHTGSPWPQFYELMVDTVCRVICMYSKLIVEITMGANRPLSALRAINLRWVFAELRSQAHAAVCIWVTSMKELVGVSGCQGSFSERGNSLGVFGNCTKISSKRRRALDRWIDCTHTCEREYWGYGRERYRTHTHTHTHTPCGCCGGARGHDSAEKPDMFVSASAIILNTPISTQSSALW